MRRLVDDYWEAGEPQSVLELADVLAAASALDVPATTPRTRARIALWGALDPPEHARMALAVVVGVPAPILVDEAVGLLGSGEDHALADRRRRAQGLDQRGRQGGAHRSCDAHDEAGQRPPHY